jgi:hypothetical protein
MPLATKMARVFWRRHPGVLVTSLNGQEYRDYNPPDRALNPRFLADMSLVCRTSDTLAASWARVDCMRLVWNCFTIALTSLTRR